MKYKLMLLVTIVLLLTTFSCTKSVENNGLTGKWKLVEQYNGYTNGGNFQWNSVLSTNSHILSFTPDGNYQKTELSNGGQVCTGTYVLQTNNKLQINSSCNTSTDTSFVSEITSKTLILDQSNIEGVIRYKYYASK